MEEKKSVLKDVVLDNINVNGMVASLLDKFAEPALKAAVEKTKTPIDDMAFAALYPTFSKELKEFIAKELEDLNAKL